MTRERSEKSDIRQEKTTAMKRELPTVQTKGKLNKVYSVDDVGPGGAHHEYTVESPDGDCLVVLKFQKGPRKEASSTSGVLECDLLEIVRDRLLSHQSGPYACSENQAALSSVSYALVALNKRVTDRIERGVFGTSQK